MPLRTLATALQSPLPAHQTYVELIITTVKAAPTDQAGLSLFI